MERRDHIFDSTSPHRAGYIAAADLIIFAPMLPSLSVQLFNREDHKDHGRAHKP
jgi:hypothetical protein